MFDQVAERPRRVRVIHQDEPSDDGIKRLCKIDLGGIALNEVNIGQSKSFCPRPGGLHCSWRLICADDLTCGTDNAGGKKADIPGAAPDIQHTHARPDSGLDKNLPRETLQQTCLSAQPLQFTVRMTKSIHGLGSELAAMVFSPPH